MPVIAINAEFLVSFNRESFCHALIVRTRFFSVKASISVENLKCHNHFKKKINYYFNNNLHPELANEFFQVLR
jgi:hypothetical protein